MELLESLRKEQILEILSDGFCHHCEARLQARIASLRKRKVYETSYSDDDDGHESSRDASYMPRKDKASVFYRIRHGEQEDGARNYIQRHEFALLMKRNRHAANSSPRYLHSKRQYLMQSDFELLNEEISGDLPFESELFDEQEQFIGYSQVGRRKNFVHNRRFEKQDDNPRNSFHRHKSTLLMKDNRHGAISSPRYLNSKRQPVVQSDFEGIDGDLPFEIGLSKEQKECTSYSTDGREEDFVHIGGLAKQEDSPQNSVRRRESALLLKHNGHDADSSPRYLNSKRQSLMQSDFELLLNDGMGGDSSFESGLSEEQKEHVRWSLVGRKMDFVHIERIDGRDMNVLEGLELHTQVFNVEEQRNIVKYVYKLQRMGKNGQFKERTYTEPRKWMRGKGRVKIQFGCCYNYARDRYGNLPGIIRDVEVDPLPHLFKKMIKRMVKWHILPPTCIPNSCIVNIYDEGDCIPPHIDHHDFMRPFSTVSLLSECDMVLGSSLKPVSPGQFQGPVHIPLPVGSVFILNGNGADVAQHCVPSVPTKRISITFRKMDDSKLPFNFSPDPELLGIKPLPHSSPKETD